MSERIPAVLAGLVLITLVFSLPMVAQATQVRKTARITKNIDEPTQSEVIEYAEYLKKLDIHGRKVGSKQFRSAEERKESLEKSLLVQEREVQGIVWSLETPHSTLLLQVQKEKEESIRKMLTDENSQTRKDLLALADDERKAIEAADKRRLERDNKALPLAQAKVADTKKQIEDAVALLADIEKQLVAESSKMDWMSKARAELRAMNREERLEQRARAAILVVLLILRIR